MGKTKRIHEGRNIKRFREMLGIKQETMAYELGEDWTQKKISQLEAKEVIDQDTLEQVAKILNITSEAIQKFNEESVIKFITKTFTNVKDNAPASGIKSNQEITFNYHDKLMEALEENKKLQEENKQLYERLLTNEREKAIDIYYLFNSLFSFNASFLDNTTALKTTEIKGTSFLSV